MLKRLSNAHMQRGSHSFHFSYPKSKSQKFYHLILTPILGLVVVFVIFAYFTNFHSLTPSLDSVLVTLKALGATFLRLLLAYVFAIVLSIPLSLLITRNQTLERILLPLFDILQSVPVLAFFPVIILIFVNSHFLNGAAVFIFFLTMLWSIVFSIVGGLRVIPNDIKSAAHIFQIKNWVNLKKITIPAIVPYLITGSLLAWAQGWNIIIVAEVLHTYILNGSASQDLFGVGSILVHSSANGNQTDFFLAIAFMMIFIGIFNFFVWQRLLTYSEKFKFE